MEITANLSIDMEPGVKSGKMRMKISDMVVTVSEGDRKVGSIAAAIGGGVEIAIGEYYYFLSAQELWRATSEAHKRRLEARAEAERNSVAPCE